MKAEKKWAVTVLVLLCTVLALIAAVVIYVDPFFHFHGTLPQFQYLISQERYQNDGILRHFDYDAIITGSSMTECFKTSEFDELFGTHSVKVPLSGGSYREIGDVVRAAEKHNDHVKLVLRCLDYLRILDNKDSGMYADYLYPTYLYDDNVFNDVNYVFNKDVLITNVTDVFVQTLSGKKTTTFDEYSNWTARFTFGKETLDSKYSPSSIFSPGYYAVMTVEDYHNILENVTLNVTDIADANPDTEFLLFFPPYSIYYFDELYRKQILDRHFVAEKYVIELLLEHENIHLYSFFLKDDVICNLDNYQDNTHYHESINSEILRWIKAGDGELTKENYEAYCEAEQAFFLNYDYDALFQTDGQAK